MLRFRKYTQAQRIDPSFDMCAICARRYPDGKLHEDRKCPPGNDCCGGYYVKVKDKAKTPKQDDRRLLKALLRCVQILPTRDGAYVVLSDLWTTLSVADARALKAIAKE